MVLNKIGYGVYSTVWLVWDLTKANDNEHRFLALKALSAESYDESQPIFEREILTHLHNGDRCQLGYKYVCHYLDDFEHQDLNGTPVCLVSELLGKTMRSFGAWFKESMIPCPVMRMFDGGAPPDGHYELKEHVAEIVYLFGPFPKRVTSEGKSGPCSENL
ncbi:hypothetical protein N657DRAFT_647837 [Parathielavia appendiculata]|uniref:non-specific serine/threonine protein kinase n=1 Tax=Parathielavia appendiculata TaxID=2587402 RepID=A0AAN6Z138_9PEZI|nr:hypothetical protein N657DRAFT_647837 [Parathielavia appendiculata]